MKKLWEIIKTWLLNKYVITVVVFVVVMVFVGEQSYRVRWHKAQQIRELKQQRDTYQRAIDQTKHDLQVLQQTDSLERYAREKYLMHAENEEVYLIDD